MKVVGKNRLVKSLVRHGLTMLAGVLVGGGIIDEAAATEIIGVAEPVLSGAAIWALAQGWSFWDKI